MVYVSGARNFTNGFVNCYIIWFVVNWFDVFMLDMWVFGMAIGIVVALVVGGLIEVLF